MTRQYNNTPTILCIYVLLVSSVGVSRHRLDTHWTPYTSSTDSSVFPTLAAQRQGKKSKKFDSGIRIHEICFIYDFGFMNPVSVIGNFGIRITETNFLTKYKKTPSFFVLVLVCSQWQIYTKGGNDRNDQNAWAIMPIAGHKNRRKIDGCKN